jgi:hypothetical protein
VDTANNPVIFATLNRSNYPMGTKELSERAVKLYQEMSDLSVWDKRDAVAILGTFIELDIRREATQPRKPK